MKIGYNRQDFFPFKLNPNHSIHEECGCYLDTVVVRTAESDEGKGSIWYEYIWAIKQHISRILG